MKSKNIQLILILLSCVSCNSEQRYATLLGFSQYYNYGEDLMFLLGDSLNLKPNKLLSKVKSSYKEDFNLIEKRPYIHTSTNKHSVEEILRNTDLLVLNYRFDDIYQTYNSGLSYGEEDQNKEIALFDYYLELTYSALDEIYQKKTVVLSLFYPLDEDKTKEMVDLANEVIKNQSKDHNYYYLDTSFMKNYIENSSYSDEGLNELKARIQKTG